MPKKSAEVEASIRSAGYAEFRDHLFEDMFLAGSDPDTERRILERAGRLDAEQGIRLLGNFAAYDAAGMPAALDALGCPVLAIQSTYMNEEHVRVPLAPGGTTPFLDLVRDRVPGARVEVVAGVGHFVMLEAAQLVNAHLESFVDGLE